MSKEKKFQHKWLFDPKYSNCEKTETSSLVYIDGKGMLCSLCQIFDTKQHHSFKAWNNTVNIIWRPDIVEGHFKNEIHKNVYDATRRRENSYFDREEEKS